MPFDNLGYLKALPAPEVGAPAKVYDRDNPPPTLSEAIRMAVADIEAQDAAGIEYRWADCEVCTAGAVCRANGAILSQNWAQFGDQWEGILEILSEITCGISFNIKRFVRYGCWERANFGPALNIKVKRNELRYSGNPSDCPRFKANMLAFADKCEAEGC